MTENSNHILETEHLNVWYGKKQVLFDVSLTMDQGSVLGLAGESGCGKTTLARTVVGMNRKYDGALRVFSKDPQMIFQDPYSSLNPAKTIGWLMEEPLRLDKQKKWTADERRARVTEVMHQVELEENLRDRYPSQLSGGQRQRICIGIALMRSPKLLIADEPVSALDVTIQAQIIQLLQNLHAELGLSVVFISHDLRVIWQLCDHTIIMREGKIVEQGETKNLYRHPRDVYTKKLLEAAGIRNTT